jgi:1-deoxy-D-xylulose-5-phosphate synthase
MRGEDYKVVAVIGDAALSTGLAFEGMNNAGHTRTNLVVLLNDNECSISKPVGAMSRYLNRVITNPLYNKVRDEAEKIVKGIPKLGPATYKTVKKFQEGLKNLLVPGILFEELGFRYFGPIDGHDLRELIAMLGNILPMKEPVIIHAVTKKGKGYSYAEKDPTRFHGVTSFDVETGKKMSDDMGEGETFTGFFSRKMAKLGGKNRNIVAITAAMPDGTGLQKFSEEYPDRFFDVGITEPHAVTFAAGLAKGGMKPVVAIYSTFMQRAYDQLIHDVALQDLPVVLCLDRAGLVGRDGPTHHGVFDISYLRSMPNFIVMAPKDGEELERMLEKALEWGRPAAIRYPRAAAHRLVGASSCAELEIGKAEWLREGKDLSMLAIGSMVTPALQAAEILSKKGIEATVINARFVKPIDKDMLEELFRRGKMIFTLEEGVKEGGFGSAIMENLESDGLRSVKIRALGLPDEFIEHGNREELLRKYNLTPDGIASTIEAELLK